MYVRSRDALVKPAKKMRIYRLLANSFWVFLLAIAVFQGLRWLFPGSAEVVAMLFMPFSLAMGVLLAPWFLISVAFTWGIIRCPCCDSRFKGVFAVVVPRVCSNCGFDIITVRRPGDF